LNAIDRLGGVAEAAIWSILCDSADGLFEPGELSAGVSCGAVRTSTSSRSSDPSARHRAGLPGAVDRSPMRALRFKRLDRRRGMASVNAAHIREIAAQRAKRILVGLDAVTNLRLM